MNVRVLLADDHQLIREALHTMITQRDPSISMVGEAENGARAVLLAHELRPDVVLMDVEMPVLNGVEATKQIVGELPNIKVLMLTMYNDPQQVVEALRLGARGYLHKNTEIDAVVHAIHAVHRGEFVVPAQLTTQVFTTLIKEKTPNDLTERQVSLLRLVAAGHTDKEIAHELNISPSRVRNQLSEIYQKLGVSNRTQAALQVRHLGLF